MQGLLSAHKIYTALRAFRHNFGALQALFEEAFASKKAKSGDEFNWR